MALAVALSKIPAHEEKKSNLLELLNEQESKLRGEISDSAKMAAELR